MPKGGCQLVAMVGVWCECARRARRRRRLGGVRGDGGGREGEVG